VVRVPLSTNQPTNQPTACITWLGFLGITKLNSIEKSQIKVAFGALTLLVWWQEGDLAYMN